VRHQQPVGACLLPNSLRESSLLRSPESESPRSPIKRHERGKADDRSLCPPRAPPPPRMGAAAACQDLVRAGPGPAVAGWIWCPACWPPAADTTAAAATAAAEPGPGAGGGAAGGSAAAGGWCCSFLRSLATLADSWCALFLASAVVFPPIAHTAALTRLELCLG
jgi:hypothetical protein